MNKYHYLNIYDTIAKTGKRPDGGDATDLEKTVAPYVAWIPVLQAGASAYAGYQIAKYSADIPAENGKKWSNPLRNIEQSDIEELSGYNPPVGGGGVSSEININGSTVTFGHGARHIDGKLNISKVQNTIANHVSQNPPTVGKSASVIISVEGKNIEYRAFNLGDGKINVGTYFIKGE